MRVIQRVVAKILLIMMVLLLIVFHPVHSILRVAFAMAEEDVAVLIVGRAPRKLYLSLTFWRSVSCMSGTHTVARVYLGGY